MNDWFTKKKLDRFSRLLNLNVNNNGSLSVLFMKLGKYPRPFFATKLSIIAKGTTFEPLHLLLYDVCSTLFGVCICKHINGRFAMVKSMIYGHLYWFCFKIGLFFFTVAVNSNRVWHARLCYDRVRNDASPEII